MPTDEEDEGQRQDDTVVVVEDLDRRWGGKPGHYALVRAFDWCDTAPDVVAWRGPEKPDEVLKKERLKEISCRTVLVDDKGFFSCRPTKQGGELYACPIDEDLENDIEKKAEDLATIMANQQAAEHASYIHDEVSDDFEGKVWVIATVGDAVAVNGEVRREAIKPPRGWVLTDRGGWAPSGSEEEIGKDDLIVAVEINLSTPRNPVHPWVIRRVLDRIYPRDYIMWSSDSSDTEIWTTKRALQKYEADQEEHARKREVQRQRQVAEQRQRAIEQRQREEEERRAKIKRGGWPRPLDWSPRGIIPP
jgi:hypothetical protein